MEHASMRHLTGAFTSVPDASPLNIALDEGAETNTVTKSCLQRLLKEALAGHVPLGAVSTGNGGAVGVPELVCMRDGVQIRAFHGADARCALSARLHVRIGRAMYPITCLVALAAPADVVLGLPFVTKYKTPHPFWLRKVPDFHPTWELSRISLGVPVGHALSLPNGLTRKHEGAQPADICFNQVVTVETAWRPWPVKGKTVSAAQASDFLQRLY